MDETRNDSTPDPRIGVTGITPSATPPDAASVPLTRGQKAAATRRANRKKHQEKWFNLSPRERVELVTGGNVVRLDAFRLFPCRRPCQAPDPALRIAAPHGLPPFKDGDLADARRNAWPGWNLRPATGADGHGAKKPDEPDYARIFNESADQWRDHNRRQKLLAEIHAELDQMPLHELRALALVLGVPSARQLHASNAQPTPAPHDPPPSSPAA